VNPVSSPGADATRLASGSDAAELESLSATFVACLTPPGRGAIAVLAIRGPRAWEAVRELFRTHSTNSKKLPANPELSRIWLGRIGEKDSATAADEVVVTAVQTDPVPWVEVHCHGGVEVVRWLMEILEGQGCQSCSWADLERVTSSNPWKTAASLEMAHATTVRTAAILLDQFHGAFERALSDIQFSLSKNDADETTRLLESLARYANVGRHLTAPWKVAVIGPPNVGKSSLVNALAGYQRSVVAPTPGTTRDLVTTSIAVDGWPVELIDTAGLRDETQILEGQGIILARRAAEEADVCLWILDASEPAVWPEDSLRKNKRLRLVINKTDLPAVWDFQGSGVLLVSARTGAGLSELVEALAKWLVPDPPAAGVAVPFTPDLAYQTEEALVDVRAGRIEETKQKLAALANQAR
jgi:tRNA modification GTPase